ncbi:hypothetical protein [Pseudomonas sp. 5P_3.1_Bac2]|uniref:hypothetical protein n=1 Tax=Pseudomonas sp. 5P_3.1_Bac2 TaxID=2971617 RepID=UPI0021C80311|nr:hypothetical protein [Pseudomonas sp. 5P_3.1_Bac2]MCU1719581.1 hypothetical protein [Pseudomonas sp. 5P_3.1_Bac2]
MLDFRLHGLSALLQHLNLGQHVSQVGLQQLPPRRDRDLPLASQGREQLHGADGHMSRA